MSEEELININGIREDLYQAMQIGDITLSSKHSQELYDFMNYQDEEIERLKQNIDYAIKLLEPIVAFGMDIAVKGKMLEPILDKLKEVNGSDKE